MTITAVKTPLAEVLKFALTEARRAVNASIRCDRCGHQGYVQVIMHNGLELWFCAHEYAALEAHLELTARTINDYRILLQPIR